ncbi:arsenate reductase family protein [Tropicimonas aquimaris]|uniref:Arsenate reductase family protein n=1 Tax=Tropicimonas aquimaris TaxID=914152 RepID=A0ABW3IMY7_9RHOB
MILFGIPTCDTCRKARKALEAAGHAVTFRDIRQEPLTSDEWEPLITAFGDGLINRRSTTWRVLSEAERARGISDLLAAHPTLMKRPVVQEGDRLTLGWHVAARAEWNV